MSVVNSWFSARVGIQIQPELIATSIMAASLQSKFLSPSTHQCHIFNLVEIHRNHVSDLEELQRALKIYGNDFFLNLLSAVYRLEEYCVKLLRKIVLSQHINRLPLPQPILDEISQTSGVTFTNNVSSACGTL